VTHSQLLTLSHDSEIFEFVIHQHKLDRAQTLFIDDTEENLLTAHKLGLSTYQMKKPEKIRDIFVDGVLKEELDIIWPSAI
jgi:FMN phosphatase YigB (HAD superfamily)